MIQRIKIITLTATTTATLLLLALVGYATLAPQSDTTAPTHAAVRARRVFFLFTPKAISDFKHPAASIRALYDALPPLAPTDRISFIFAVGSHDHILRYGPALSARPLPIVPMQPFAYAHSTQTNAAGITALTIEPHGAFTLRLKTSLPITATTALTWNWHARDQKNVVVRFFVTNTTTGETDTLTYRANARELRPGFDQWDDFLIDPPLATAATSTISLAQDLFRKRTPDQNTHLVEQESWLLTALEFTGDAAVFGVSALQQSDGGINWARTVYSPAAIAQPLAQRSRRYPQALAYEDIKNIVAELHHEGRRRGQAVDVLDALEGSTEFSRQDWLYAMHPEALFIPQRPALPTFDVGATLIPDAVAYAAFPHGIPAGLTSAEFLIRQTQRYFSDMNFDGLYLMNAFGTKAAWYPQRALGATATQSLMNFFTGLRAALPDAYLLWMDSYYPRWVEQEHYGLPENFYDLIDGLQIATFWQDSDKNPIIRWNPEGMFGTMRETVTSKIKLKQKHPQLDVLGTFYVRDPWYPFGYEANTSTRWFDDVRSTIDGFVLYSLNDAYGEIKKLPENIIPILQK